MKTKLVLLIGALLLIVGVIGAQAQVTGQVTITLTAEQYAHVKAAVETHNANNGADLSVLDWASEVATKAIVEKAQQDNAVELKAIRYVWPELTKAEREALIARKKAILDARQNAE